MGFRCGERTFVESFVAVPIIPFNLGTFKGARHIEFSLLSRVIIRTLETRARDLVR